MGQIIKSVDRERG